MCGGGLGAKAGGISKYKNRLFSRGQFLLEDLILLSKVSVGKHGKAWPTFTKGSLQFTSKAGNNFQILQVWNQAQRSQLQGTELTPRHLQVPRLLSKALHALPRCFQHPQVLR